jgi:hypothetical protein
LAGQRLAVPTHLFELSIVRIQVNFSALAKSRWYEYVARFVFGGVVTALAGYIATRYGPETGGLFLAFPAIFPATATLLEKHEERKSEREKGQSKLRGRVLAGLDAAGAAMGSIGLAAFGLIVWRGFPGYSPAWILTFAAVGWMVLSVLSWWGRKTLLPQIRRWHRR